MEYGPDPLCNYERMSEASREKHRERSRQRKRNLRIERLKKMLVELREIRYDAYENLELAEIDNEKAHKLLKSMKYEIKEEVKRRIQRGQNPIFGTESAKFFTQLEVERKKKEERLDAMIRAREIFLMQE